MALTSNPTSLKEQINKANPNTVPTQLQTLEFGNVLLALPTTLRRSTTAVSPYAPAATQSVPLPEDARACTVLAAYARAGAGTAGPLAVQAKGAVPAAGQISVLWSGEIATAAADAWTEVDVTYVPEKYDVRELVAAPVVADVLTLPEGITDIGAVVLIEVEALTGGAPGEKIILAPGTAVAAGEAAFSTDLLTVTFAAADAVTSARVKLGVVSRVDVQAVLEATSTLL